MKTAGPILGLIFIGGIFAVFCWMDVRVVQILLRQYRAESYQRTEGKIFSADVVTSTGSKGRIYYHPTFVYIYEVAGRDYTGRCYRYDGYPSDRASAEQIVDEHQRGSSVDVYFDPSNPADAVLSPRVVAHDVSSIFLSSSLLFMFLYGLIFAWREVIWPGGPEVVAGGVKIISEMMTTRVRLPRYLPSIFVLITAGSLTLLSGIVIQVAEFDSPTRAGLEAVLIIVVASAAVYAWRYQIIASGQQDLVIDFGNRTITLPLTYKRQERRPRPLSTIKAVSVEKVWHARRAKERYTYAPTLHFRDGTSERLIDLKRKQAKSFTKWLKKKLVHST